MVAYVVVIREQLIDAEQHMLYTDMARKAGRMDRSTLRQTIVSLPAQARDRRCCAHASRGEKQIATPTALVARWTAATFRRSCISSR